MFRAHRHATAAVHHRHWHANAAAATRMASDQRRRHRRQWRRIQHRRAAAVMLMMMATVRRRRQRRRTATMRTAVRVRRTLRTIAVGQQQQLVGRCASAGRSAEDAVRGGADGGHIERLQLGGRRRRRRWPRSGRQRRRWRGQRNLWLSLRRDDAVVDRGRGRIGTVAAVGGVVVVRRVVRTVDGVIDAAAVAVRAVVDEAGGARSGGRTGWRHGASGGGSCWNRWRWREAAWRTRLRHGARRHVL